MKYLIFSLLFFQLLIANEISLKDDESFFKKQAEIQAIIDEQFPKKEYIEEIDDENSYANKILLDEDVEFNSDSLSVKQELPKQDLFKKAKVDEQFSKNQKSKNVYTNYEKFPKIIFENQRFDVVLKTTITTDEFDKIETRFINLKNVTVLNNQNEWKYGGKNNFYNKYHLKILSKNFKMPTFQVVMYKDGKIFEITTLKPKKLKLTNVSKDNEKFSNVIAKELEIVTHKTKQYTNNKLLTILELKTTQGNLEDFYLKDFVEQGVSSIEEKGTTQTAIYYSIIPLHTKKVSFDYYNSELKSFVRKQSAVVLKNELVSTQTDLNPNKSNVLLYKKIFFGFLVILFFILYLIRRRFLYICITLIFLIIFIVYNLPNERVKIKQGSNIFILPTNKSTIFYKIEKVQKVEVLNQKDIFLKIAFKKTDEKKETIGWIKEINIVKN